jgi:hypothetical protein
MQQRQLSSWCRCGAFFGGGRVRGELPSREKGCVRPQGAGEIGGGHCLEVVAVWALELLRDAAEAALKLVQVCRL